METELNINEPAGQSREPEDRIEAYRRAREEQVLKTGSTMTGNLTIPAPTQDGHAVNREYVYTGEESATLTAAGWAGSGPYTQPVTVAALTDGRLCSVHSAYGDDTAANLAMREACGCLSYAKREGQNVTFTCLADKPETDVDVVLEVYV